MPWAQRPLQYLGPRARSQCLGLSARSSTLGQEPAANALGPEPAANTLGQEPAPVPWAQRLELSARYQRFQREPPRPYLEP